MTRRPLDLDQVITLLAVVVGYDGRFDASHARILVWAEAARRGRWTYDEAEEAVHQHYLESTDYLMPAHIGQRIRATRQDAAMRATAAELGAAGPVRPEVRAAIESTAEAWLMSRSHDGLPVADQATRDQARQMLNEQLAAGRAEDPQPDIEHQARREPCDYCHARPFNPCTAASRGGRRDLAVSHPSRRAKITADQGATP